MDKKELLDDIINLKSRQEVLKAECDDHTIHTDALSATQLNQMTKDEDLHINPEIALQVVTEQIENDERLLKQEITD